VSIKPAAGHGFSESEAIRWALASAALPALLAAIMFVAGTRKLVSELEARIKAS